MGYPEKSGYCHGFSLRWLEACFSNDLPTLDERSKYLLEHEPEEFIQHIEAIKEKSKQKLQLTEEENKLMQILGFFDSLSLYHTPRSHKPILGDSYYQEDYTPISAIASSDIIRSKGGLAKIGSHMGIYTQNELASYLEELEKCFEDNSKEPVGLLLHNHDHAIALFYTPGSKCWKAMDINQYHPDASPFLRNRNKTPKELAAFIAKGFASTPHVTFNLDIVVHGQHANRQELQVALQKKESYGLTPTAVKEADLLSFATIAIEKNQPEALKAVQERGVNLNQINEDGDTPACIAAYRGNIEMIKYLGKSGVDLNKPNRGSFTPAQIAAQCGHAEVINVLGELGINLSKIFRGPTLAHLAAWEGHADVIQALGKWSMDLLNKPNNEGKTPAYIAAMNGHTDVLKSLKENGVALNKTIHQGKSLIHVAIENGHPETLQFLLQDEWDTEILFDALFAAFQNGHNQIVNVLLQKPLLYDHERFLTLPVENLRKIMNQYGEEAVTRMEHFISKQTTQEIHCTLLDIAGLIGNKAVVDNLLAQALEEGDIKKLPPLAASHWFCENPTAMQDITTEITHYDDIKTRINKAIDVYVCHKNRFFSVPWLFSSSESAQCKKELAEAHTSKSRERIIRDFINKHPENSFALALQQYFPDEKPICAPKINKNEYYDESELQFKN